MKIINTYSLNRNDKRRFQFGKKKCERYLRMMEALQYSIKISKF